MHALSPSIVFCACVALTLLASARAAAQCTEGCVAIHTLLGEAAGDQFGWEARVLGDIDGDGAPDFIVSAPTHDSAGVDSGRVYVYSGATGAELYHLDGAIAGTWFGFSSNPVGDVDGDDIPDFIVGTPFTLRGQATLHSGVDGALLHTFQGEVSGDQFGTRAVGGGDVDFDGVPDLLVGAPLHDATGTDAGRVYLYSGASRALLCTADGVDAGDQFGNSLSFIGDRDFDGRSDYVVGADNAGIQTNGRAYPHSYDGAACIRGTTLTPGTPSFSFGQFFADGGDDVDADGVPDFYVADFNANRAHVFSGATLAKIWSLSGDGSGGFGLGEMTPDLDNDGHADLVLAAWVSNIGGTQAGKVFVYSGRTGLALQTMTHDIAGATFGFDAAGIDDLNDDGREDFLITAAWDAAQRGTVYVIAGQVTPFITGDLDFSGCIDLSDVGVLLADFNCTSGDCAGDADRDGDTDLSDLGIMLAAFGECRD